MAAKACIFHCKNVEDSEYGCKIGEREQYNGRITGEPKTCPYFKDRKYTNYYMRYTLHYVHRICIDKRFDDWIPRWEKIDFKTLREAREYLAIADENAYIVDNVTKQKMKEL